MNSDKFEKVQSSLQHYNGDILVKLDGAPPDAKIVQGV